MSAMSALQNNHIRLAITAVACPPTIPIPIFIFAKHYGLPGFTLGKILALLWLGLFKLFSCISHVCQSFEALSLCFSCKLIWYPIHPLYFTIDNRIGISLSVFRCAMGNFYCSFSCLTVFQKLYEWLAPGKQSQIIAVVCQGEKVNCTWQKQYMHEG